MFPITLSGPDDLEGLEGRVDEALVGAVENAAEVIATSARNDHPYVDRTNALTESIEELPAVRSGDGLVVGGVIAGAAHAEHLERRPEYAFLGPAADRSRERIDHDTEERLRAGLR